MLWMILIGGSHNTARRAMQIPCATWININMDKPAQRRRISEYSDEFGNIQHAIVQNNIQPTFLGWAAINKNAMPNCILGMRRGGSLTATTTLQKTPFTAASVGRGVAAKRRKRLGCAPVAAPMACRYWVMDRQKTQELPQCVGDIRLPDCGPKRYEHARVRVDGILRIQQERDLHRPRRAPSRARSSCLATYTVGNLCREEAPI